MRVLEAIATLDPNRLVHLEQHAVRLAAAGSDKQKGGAECVLLAIKAERTRRKVEASDQQLRFFDFIVRLQDKGPFDRVLLPSTEKVPEQWQAKVVSEKRCVPANASTNSRRYRHSNSVLLQSGI